MMHSDLDVMPVRADEQFNCQDMQIYLQTHVAHAEGPLEVRQFGGGHANLTYLLRMGEQAWVMRRPPLGPRSEEHTSELQSLTNLVCRLLLEKKKKMLLGQQQLKKTDKVKNKQKD